MTYASRDIEEIVADIEKNRPQELQKAREAWLRELREEIVKLEMEKNNIDVCDYDSDERGKREILQTIIDRYQSELEYRINKEV